MVINKVLHDRKAKYPVQVKISYAPVKTHSLYKKNIYEKHFREFFLTFVSPTEKDAHKTVRI